MNDLWFLENAYGKPPGACVFLETLEKAWFSYRDITTAFASFSSKDLRCPGINYKTNLRVLKGCFIEDTF